MSIQKILIPKDAIQFVELWKPEKLEYCKKVKAHKTSWFDRFWYSSDDEKWFDHPEWYISYEYFSKFFMTEEEIKNSKNYILIDGEVYKKPYITIWYVGWNTKTQFPSYEEALDLYNQLKDEIQCVSIEEAQHFISKIK